MYLKKNCEMKNSVNICEINGHQLEWSFFSVIIQRLEVNRCWHYHVVMGPDQVAKLFVSSQVGSIIEKSLK